MLALGTKDLCDEVVRRSVPLSLSAGAPPCGRFFPTTCSVRTLANNNTYLQFGGHGYAWTTASRRIGFESSGGVEYDTDFLLAGSTIYAYFRQRSMVGTAFTSRTVENQQASFFGSLPLGNGGQSLTNSLGTQIMEGQLARGFTVIRKPRGDVELGMGVVPFGGHPPAPFQNVGNDRLVLANERVELHSDQRDYVGPFEVPSGADLVVQVVVEGAPAIDILLLPRFPAEQWLSAYVTQAATTPPPAQPLLDDVALAGALWKKTFQAPPGVYYLVLDNTSTAGHSSPSASARDARGALVSYAIELAF